MFNIVGKGVAMLCYIAIIFFLQSSLYDRTVGFHNLALNGSAFQSSTYKTYGAHLANDGTTDQIFSAGSCSHTATNQSRAWWSLDIGQLATIHNVIIYYRSEQPGRLNGYYLYISHSFDDKNPNSGHECFHYSATVDPDIIQNQTCDTVGRYVVIYKDRPGISDSHPILELCEVKVFGCYFGKYGYNCEHFCSPHCTAETSCHVTTGACTCESGYQGQTCHESTPRISVITTDITAQISSTVILEVYVPTVYPNINEISWFKNNKRIYPSSKVSGGNIQTPSLTIVNVDAEDDGIYTCMVSNILGNVSAEIKLFTWSVPSIVVSERKLVVVGVTVTISCNVTNSKPNVQRLDWEREWDSSTVASVAPTDYKRNANGLSFVIESITKFDAGRYVCYAFNGYANRTAHTDIYVGDLPRISVTANDVNVQIHTTATLEVSIAKVYPPVNIIYWLKNNERINTSRKILGGNIMTPSLTITNVDANDDGIYKCRVSNGLGFDSVEIKLLIWSKPSMSVPGNTFVAVGRTVTIHCNVTLSKPIITSHVWKRVSDGFTLSAVLVTDNKSNERVDILSYVIKSVTKADAGRYVCIAFNGYANSTAHTDIYVGDVPKIKFTTNYITAKIFTNVILQVEVPNVYLPIQLITWLKNKTTIYPPRHQLFSGGNITTISLTINYVNADDDGTYTCIVNNHFGSGFGNITLFTWDMPLINVTTKHFLAVGAYVSIYCYVKYSKPYVRTLVWNRLKDGLMLTSNKGVDTLFFVIHNITKADSGRYVCTAFNGYANNTAHTDIDVGDVPRITVKYYNVEAQIYSNVTLQVAVPIIQPAVSYLAWSHKGTLIYPSRKFSGGNVRTPSLTITNVDANDDGIYTCRISNSLGSDIVEFKILTWSKPMIVVSDKQSVGVGGTASIRCEVTYSKPNIESLIWKKESGGSIIAFMNVTHSRSIKHVNELPFVITNITKIHSGRYVCIAFNGYANTTAHTDIDVGDVPSVTLFSDVFISTTRTNTTLACKVNNVTKNASIYWMHKSKLNKHWENISTNNHKHVGSTLDNPDLLVTNVQLEDAGTYNCCVSDIFGNACHKAELKVLSVYTYTTNVTQNVNETAKLGCYAVGGNILAWRHNNGLISGTNTNRFIGGTIQNPSLFIHNLSRDDAGYYTCETSYDNVTVVSPSIYLDVKDKPYVIRHDTSVKGSSGDFIQLKCQHESNPPPTSVFWTKNGKQIIVTDSATTKFNGSSVLNPSLVISNADTSDSGTYVCGVTNSLGTGYGDNITLTVQDLGDHGKTSLIIGLLTAVFLVTLLVLIAVFVLRRRRSNIKQQTSMLNQTLNSNTQYVNVTKVTNYGNDLYINSASASTSMLDSLAPPVIQLEATNQSDSEYYNISDETKLVKVEELKQYIDRRQINDELRKEYKSMPYGAKLPTKQAQLKDNMPKNRFKTTFPYDHSRVVLEVLDGIDNSDYINANFIDGFRKDKCYIASQGPTKLTLFDHWRMIWQYKVRRIVMLTNLIEGTKAKCELYWPGDTKMSCGHFVLTLVSEKQRATYITREIVAENTKTKEKRTIVQYHFISWPDHGTPDPLYLVLFHGHVKMDLLKDENGPLLVHCSAGIGRTGTYIALDSLCKEGLASGYVNFVKCVERMRLSRMNMIQTADQYVCLHYTLLEAFAMTNTNIRREQFLQIWHEINYDSPSNNKQRLHEEFMILTKKKSKKDQSNYRAAKSPENIGKNRNHDVVPADGCRVFLVSNTADRSDYINAVQVPSYTKLDGFLVTQLPLPDTKIDFWTMIHDHKSTTIVLLLKDTEEADMVYTQPHDLFKIGRFHLKVVAKESENQHLTTLTLNVSTKNTKPRDVIVYQAVCTGIPDATLLCRLVDLITAKVRTSDNPITVVSSDGAKNCGLFCTFANAVSSITMDNSADIFNLSRVIQFKQPEFFANFEEYKRCYEALCVYLESSNVYANL